MSVVGGSQEGNLVPQLQQLTPHSDLCYEGKMSTLREFLLLLFHKNRYVKRKEIVQASGIAADVVMQQLTEIAVRKKKQHKKEWVWKLILPADQDFIERYPHVVEKYDRYWEENTGM